MKNKNDIIEIIKGVKRDSETFEYDYNKILDTLKIRLNPYDEEFVTSPKMVEATKNLFSKAAGYEENKFNEFIKSLTPESLLKEEFDNAMTNDVAGISCGNAFIPRPPLEDIIEDLEESEEFEKKVLAKAVKEAIVDFSSQKKCEEYSFAFKNKELFKVNTEGEALYKVCQYKPLLQKIEVQNSALTSPEVAEINARIAKEKGWDTVSLIPPSNGSAEEFMNVNLRALMNPDFGYQPDEIYVPKAFEPLKAMIAAELLNTAKLTQATPEQIQEREQAPDPTPVVEDNIDNDTSLDSIDPEAAEALSQFDNDSDIPLESLDSDNPDVAAPAAEVDDFEAIDHDSEEKPENDDSTVSYDSSVIDEISKKELEEPEAQKKGNKVKRSI